MASTAMASIQYAPEDPTLPKPWRGLIDGKTGYIYFWNPDTNITQYERPMSSTAPLKPSLFSVSSSVQVQPSSQGQNHAYIPEKEDDRYNRDKDVGSKFDGGSRSNQLQYSTCATNFMAANAMAATQCAPEDPTLPKPWRGLIDGKTGYIYFWNSETNITQYERPMSSTEPLKPSLFSVSSSVQVQPSSQGQYNAYIPEKEDDRYNRDKDVGSKFDGGSRSNRGMNIGLTQSHNGTNGTIAAVHGGSTRLHGSSDGGNNLFAEAYRRRHEITVIGGEVPEPFTSFEATGFPSEILREVQNAGFSVPTPIQAQSWPVALQSRDIIAIAKTGSGKTLGYLIPGFINLKRSRNNPRLGPSVLVLSPTRELATQILDEALKFGKSSRISCTCLYGGAPKGPQLRDLDRGTDIVVATPGRLNDILEMKRVSLQQVSYLVLDEADRMLDMGFEPQIRKIVKEVRAQRQTLMFTATWPREVRKIAADLLVNPVQVHIGNVDELMANKSITQYVEVLSPVEKHRRMEQILRSQEPGSKIIIFCATKKMCDQLTRNLNRQFGAAAIHGDKSQSERDYVLNQFRTGKSPVLVATDVAARGLDIKDIRVVINYDFPTGVEDYVHRIGRTGRAGATGVAYTFFSDQDAKHASELIKVLEGANQQVPREIREMASRGGGMVRSKRWGSGGCDGVPGGGSDFGYGGRGSTYSSGRTERGGGRGYGRESHDRYSHGYFDGSNERRCSRSRSPQRFNRAQSKLELSPERSSHKGMMDRGGSLPPQNRYVPPYKNENAKDYRKDNGGHIGRPHFGDEEEEGIIKGDNFLPPVDGGM